MCFGMYCQKFRQGSHGNTKPLFRNAFLLVNTLPPGKELDSVTPLDQIDWRVQ